MLQTVISVEKTGHGKGVTTLREADGAWEWARAWEMVERMVALGWSATITEESIPAQMKREGMPAPLMERA